MNRISSYQVMRQLDFNHILTVNKQNLLINSKMNN